jgi:hypothetical protein
LGRKWKRQPEAELYIDFLGFFGFHFLLNRARPLFFSPKKAILYMVCNAKIKQYEPRKRKPPKFLFRLRITAEQDEH